MQFCLIKEKNLMKFEIIDTNYLNEISTNPVFIKKMLALFRANVSEFEIEMNALLKDKEFEKLGELAHKAKSSVIILGMKKEADELKQLELDTKSGIKEDSYQQRVNEFIETCKKALVEIDILEKEL